MVKISFENSTTEHIFSGLSFSIMFTERILLFSILEYMIHKIILNIYLNSKYNNRKTLFSFLFLFSKNINSETISNMPLMLVWHSLSSGNKCLFNFISSYSNFCCCFIFFFFLLVELWRLNKLFCHYYNKFKFWTFETRDWKVFFQMLKYLKYPLLIWEWVTMKSLWHSKYVTNPQCKTHSQELACKMRVPWG